MSQSQQIPDLGKAAQVKKYLYNDTGSAISAGDVVKMSADANGLGVAAIADDTTVYMPVVALEDVAAGEHGAFCVEGPCTVTVPSATYTAGNGLDILDGAVRDSTATAQQPNGVVTQNDFAVITTGGTTVTSVEADLYGQAITGQT